MLTSKEKAFINKYPKLTDYVLITAGAVLFSFILFTAGLFGYAMYLVFTL